MKLRISHLIVQAVLVYDDGDELTAGPELQPISLPLSKLAQLAESLPDEVANLQVQLEAQPQRGDDPLSD
jgi:hypothetical protein